MNKYTTQYCIAIGNKLYYCIELLLSHSNFENTAKFQFLVKWHSLIRPKTLGRLIQYKSRLLGLLRKGNEEKELNSNLFLRSNF